MSTFKQNKHNLRCEAKESEAKAWAYRSCRHKKLLRPTIAIFCTLADYHKADDIDAAGLELFEKWLRNRSAYPCCSLETSINFFTGVPLVEYDSLETLCSIRIHLYTRTWHGPTSRYYAKILRNTSLLDARYPLVNLHMRSVDDLRDVVFIADMNAYSGVYPCTLCHAVFKRSRDKIRHQRTCSLRTKIQYSGGPYYVSPTIFEKLEHLSVVVNDLDRFHKYRATFDFEAYLPPSRLSRSSIRRHVPMSVSVYSNVPDNQGPYTFISEGCPQKIIDDMMECLEQISDAAYALECIRYADHIMKMDVVVRQQESEVIEKKRKYKTPARRIADAFDERIRVLPVVGFNSSRYDIPMIKPYLAKYLMGTAPNCEIPHPRRRQPIDSSEIGEHDDVGDVNEDDALTNDDHDGSPKSSLTSIITKGNTVVLLKTDKLEFLDVLNYLAPGTSYSDYLKAYGQDKDLKSYFPYEYVTDLAKLDEKHMPPYESFWSSMRGVNTLELSDRSDEPPCRGRCEAVYAGLLKIWHSKNMSCLRDWLRHYNEADVVPFMRAIDRHAAVLKDLGVDNFKSAPTLPGLSLRYALRDLGGLYHTLGADQSDIHESLRTGLVGGLAQVMHRYARVDQTFIHANPNIPCKRLLGLDCNSLYPWAIAQLQPLGPAIVRNPPEFAPKGPELFGGLKAASKVGVDWLVYMEQTLGCKILHAGNEGEVRLGLKQVPVDGWAPDTATVYQFHGCYWHCHDKCPAGKLRFAKNDAAPSIGAATSGDSRNPHTVPIDKMTSKEWRKMDAEKLVYLKTYAKAVVIQWECDWQRRITERHSPEFEFVLKRQNDSLAATLRRSRAANADASYPDATRLVAQKRVKYTMDTLLTAIRNGDIFGAARVDIKTPDALKAKFHGFPPVVKHANISRADIGDFMRAHCEETNSLLQPRPSLISSYYGENILITTPLLQWYIRHGLEVTHVYQFIEWEPGRPLRFLADITAQYRREADSDSRTKCLGNTYKLLSNSVYGKCCQNSSRFQITRFCRGLAVGKYVNLSRYRKHRRLETASEYDQQALATSHHRLQDKHSPVDVANAGDLESTYNVVTQEDVNHEYEQAELDICIEPDVIYEVDLAPRKVVEKIPIQIAVFVYQQAKLRMLEFRYDFLHKFLDTTMFCDMYTDTDSLYLSLGAATLDLCVKRHMLREYYSERHFWLPTPVCEEHRSAYVRLMSETVGRYVLGPLLECCSARFQYDQRTPGLFKIEFSGLGMVALCAKTYYCLGEDSAADKYSSKGLQKRSNNFVYTDFFDVLDTRRRGFGVNRGIKKHVPTGQFISYEEKRAGLSYFYGKRKVRSDGITTDPLDI